MTALWNDITLCEAISGKLVGPSFVADGAALHTNLVQKGDIFFALQGASTDGHHYVEQAFEKGAAVAVVQNIPEGIDTEGRSFIIVQDTLRALLEAAAYNRERFDNAKVIAVTGSVGKTTTREMLAHALEAYGPVFASQKNYNTLEGVSIDLCRCPLDRSYVVLEVGMNHPGEIAPTSLLIQPDLAMITKTAENHLEFFDSLEGIAYEKAQIFMGLKEKGIGVIGIDGHNPSILKDVFEMKAPSHHLITVSSIDESADVFVSEKKGVGFLKAKETLLSFELCETGAHFYYSAGLVAAALQGLDLPLKAGMEALKEFRALLGRGALVQMNVTQDAGQSGQATLIDESYNAGFTSTKAALDRLAGLTAIGKKILVFGGMGELGATTEDYHKALIPVIEASGVDQVFCCGVLSKTLFEELPEPLQGHWTLQSNALLPFVEKAIQPGDVVLIKGSLSTNMRFIVEGLTKQA
jgi:UDP-N-acetylmuramoyl-tripeptide--D-alanyl-D-alanine ligase